MWSYCQFNPGSVAAKHVTSKPMPADSPNASVVPAVAATILGLSCLGAALVTGAWVLTAVPIGLLFGFFLQKADLCGSSAFSEALMFKDWRKLGGIGVIVVASMAGFALLDLAGLIKLNPKPLLWASAIVGGVVFGVGTVLAGGCVSGTLFKCGQGNLNTMIALLTIPVGVSAVSHGPLKPFAKWLDTKVITASNGDSVTLPSLTGAPYWALASIFALGTVAFAVWYRKQHRAAPPGNSSKHFLLRPWKPWQAGIAIGALACAAYLSSAASGRNYPLGVTHGVMHAQLLVTDDPVTHVWKKKPAVPTPTLIQSANTALAPKPKKVVWWLVLVVSATVAGSFASAKLDGRFRLLPKPPDEMLVAGAGGLLVGTGAALAGGCVVGNIMSGFALMSVGNLLFGVTVLFANWAATYVYLMGGLRR